MFQALPDPQRNPGAVVAPRQVSTSAGSPEPVGGLQRVLSLAQQQTLPSGHKGGIRGPKTRDGPRSSEECQCHSASCRPMLVRRSMTRLLSVCTVRRSHGRPRTTGCRRRRRLFTGDPMLSTARRLKAQRARPSASHIREGRPPSLAGVRASEGFFIASLRRTTGLLLAAAPTSKG